MTEQNNEQPQDLPNVPVNALSNEEQTPTINVVISGLDIPLKDLSEFFLRLVFAAIPAGMVIALLYYILTTIISMG